MRLRFLCLSILLASTQSHAADARFSCAVDTPPLKLSVDTAFNVDQGRKLIHFRAAWIVDDPSLPESLRNMRLDSETLTHSWFDERRLMLHVYQETSGEKPFASLDLVVMTETTGPEAKIYRGTYSLTQQSAASRRSETRGKVEHQGKITCTKG